MLKTRNVDGKFRALWPQKICELNDWYKRIARENKEAKIGSSPNMVLFCLCYPTISNLCLKQKRCVIKRTPLFTNEAVHSIALFLSSVVSIKVWNTFPCWLNTCDAYFTLVFNFTQPWTRNWTSTCPLKTACNLAATDSVEQLLSFR